MNDVDETDYATDIPHWSFFVVYNPTFDKYMIKAGKTKDNRHWCVDWVDDPEQEGCFGHYYSPLEFYYNMCQSEWMLCYDLEDDPENCYLHVVDEILSWSMIPVSNNGRIEHENAFNIGREIVGYEEEMEQKSK